MSNTEKLQVLVADDDAVSLHVAVRAIENAGYEAIPVRDGATALQVMLQQGPPMLVTDWIMPRMDGLELCRAIREHEGIGFVYIIALAGHSDVEHMVKAFDAGVDDYLTKPAKPRELAARLRAGERIIRLQHDLDRRSREAYRFSAEMQIAQTRLAEVNDRLRRIVVIDELTGLANRRDALQRLDELWASARRHDEPLSCVMLDIDHFKRFNDTHGHAIGDVVLKAVAHKLEEASRDDEPVCRVGGEEFLVLCPKSTRAAAARGAERLRHAVESRRVRSGELDLAVTVSVGVAEATPEMETPDQLLKAADDALYAAKQAGRNCVRVANADISEDESANIGRPAEEPDDSLSDAQGADRRAPLVLVVDDDEATRRLCSTLLTRAGYEVTEAKDGMEAIAQVDERHPDVIIMDAMMPNMDGLECTKRLKSTPSTSVIPIIMASARTEDKYVISALECGVDEYVKKPIKPREFVLRVRSMLRLRRGMLDLLQSNDVRGEQTRVLAMLLDFTRELAAAHDLDMVLAQTIASTADLTCCQRVAVMLPDPEEEGTLVMVKAVGIPQLEESPIRVRAGEGIAGQVYQSRSMVLANTEQERRGLARGSDSVFFGDAPMVAVPLIASGQVVGVLSLTARQDDRPFEPHELECILFVSNIAASAIHDCLSRAARDDARDSIVVALAKLAEFRDNDTGRHLERVTRYSDLLARQLRAFGKKYACIDDEFLAQLERAVPLHDIGKVAIPDYILQKPGRHTDEETAIMRTHAAIGAATIRTVLDRLPTVRFLQMAERIAHRHHEWYDGGGYPDGLAANAIPLAARIVAVADVYDALTTKRVYKDAMPHDRAVDIIFQSSRTQFDPEVVEAFRRCSGEFLRLARELADDPLDSSEPAPTPTPVLA